MLTEDSPGPAGSPLSVAQPEELLPFEPPRWLSNRHVQSIWPSLPLRRPFVTRRVSRMLGASHDIVLDCGDDVRLQGHLAASAPGMGSARDLAVLLHGWEGSANSLYLLSLAGALFDRGWDVLRLNLRDHGDSHHLNTGLFHSCRIAEVVGAVRRMQELRPDARVALAGFSLGGNFSLRVGVRAAKAGLRLRRIVAVCPVLDPRVTMQVLETGPALYRDYFIFKWKRSLRRKKAAWPDHYHFDDLLRMRSLLQMTGAMVSRYTEFATLDDYLAGYAITGEALAPLEVPSRLITSLDDPIILAGDLSRLKGVPALSIGVTRQGGHCGFVDAFGGESWIDRSVVAELERD